MRSRRRAVGMCEITALGDFQGLCEGWETDSFIVGLPCFPSGRHFHRGRRRDFRFVIRPVKPTRVGYWGATGRVAPGNFTPRPLTDPYVNLSIHMAPRSHALASFEACLLWKKRLILVNQLAKPSVELRHPLRSTPITGASTLLPDDPSSADASLLSRFVVPTYRFSLSITCRVPMFHI